MFVVTWKHLPLDHKERSVPLRGEEVDLRHELKSWPWSVRQGGARNKTLGSLADCITSGMRLSLLSYTLLGERV